MVKEFAVFSSDTFDASKISPALLLVNGKDLNEKRRRNGY